MFSGKGPVTASTIRPATLANGDGDQRPGKPMTGGATAVLLGRSSQRYPTGRPLRPTMAAGTIGGETNQRAVVLAGVSGRKTTMTGMASAATKVAEG